MFNRTLSYLAGLVAVASPSLVLAQATAYDVSAATAELDNVAATVAVVGVAIIALAAIALGYRWIKAAFF